MVDQVTYMIEVFKTNVEEEHHAHILISSLMKLFPDSRINFDLDDCDRILRIEGHSFSPARVMELLQEQGFSCYLLDWSSNRIIENQNGTSLPNVNTEWNESGDVQLQILTGLNLRFSLNE